MQPATQPTQLAPQQLPHQARQVLVLPVGQQQVLSGCQQRQQADLFRHQLLPQQVQLVPLLQALAVLLQLAAGA
jgi:hypothetical protein